MDEIEARNFTWCSAFYPDMLLHQHFVVMTPVRGEARDRAAVYAREHWGEPKTIHVYPRTYVRDARAAYRAGHHD